MNISEYKGRDVITSWIAFMIRDESGKGRSLSCTGVGMRTVPVLKLRIRSLRTVIGETGGQWRLRRASPCLSLEIVRRWAPSCLSKAVSELKVWERKWAGKIKLCWLGLKRSADLAKSLLWVIVKIVDVSPARTGVREGVEVERRALQKWWNILWEILLLSSSIVQQN